MTQSKTRRPGRPAGSSSGEGRAALLKAAQELMAEKGLPRVTLREVADRAGVQPGLVNYYFGGKEGLFRAVVGAVAQEMLERIQAAVAGEGSPEERVREFVRGMVEAATAAPYAPRLMVEQVLFGEAGVVEEFVANFARPNLAAMLELLEDGQRSGRFRSVDPRYTIPAMAGACIFFFLSSPVVRRLYEIEPIDAEIARDFADSTAEMILHGIVGREAPTA
jgi:AcrR family transcriptional regulator